jgi:hypothetical protein
MEGENLTQELWNPLKVLKEFGFKGFLIYIFSK